MVHFVNVVRPRLDLSQPGRRVGRGIAEQRERSRVGSLPQCGGIASTCFEVFGDQGAFEPGQRLMQRHGIGTIYEHAALQSTGDRWTRQRFWLSDGSRHLFQGKGACCYVPVQAVLLSSTPMHGAESIRSASATSGVALFAGRPSRVSRPLRRSATRQLGQESDGNNAVRSTTPHGSVQSPCLRVGVRGSVDCSQHWCSCCRPPFTTDGGVTVATRVPPWKRRATSRGSACTLDLGSSPVKFLRAHCQSEIESASGTATTPPCRVRPPGSRLTHAR